MSKFLTPLVLTTLIWAASGCTHVAPFEREYLARPGMDPDKRTAPYGAFLGHILEAREGAGAVGMSGASGGGCGCN